MRKHKFKAWSIPEKRWINLNGFCISFNGCNDEGAVYEVTEQGVLHVIAVEDVKIVEWTGLSDKKGVEIFEGDIVGVDAVLGHGYGREILFRKGCFGFEAIPNVSEDLCYLEVWTEDVEIIGNIYENADLKGESQ